MRIQGLNRIAELYKGRMTKVEQVKAPKQDQVELSTLAKDYQFALNAARKVPDIRQKEVEGIKERMQSGTYNIDAQEVSEKIWNQFDMKG